ncbi:MAG: hypothetical protein ABIH67_02400 [Candidatus Uhrbacteria bacterium]
MRETEHAMVLVNNKGRAQWKQICVVKYERGGACLNPDCVQRLQRQGKTILRRYYVGIDPTPEKTRPQTSEQTHLYLISEPTEKPRRLRRRIFKVPAFS